MVGGITTNQCSLNV